MKKNRGEKIRDKVSLNCNVSGMRLPMVLVGPGTSEDRFVRHETDTAVVKTVSIAHCHSTG
jgi:hypothetical protein